MSVCVRVLVIEYHSQTCLFFLFQKNLSVSCVINWKTMLPLDNNEISLLTILIIIHRSNNHLSITTTETSSPKWSLYTGLTVLSILSVIRHLICGNNLNWLINLNLTYETLWNGVRSCLLISMLGKLSWFRLTSLIANDSIDVKMVVATWNC